MFYFYFRLIYAPTLVSAPTSVTILVAVEPLPSLASSRPTRDYMLEKNHLSAHHLGKLKIYSRKYKKTGRGGRVV